MLVLSVYALSETLWLLFLRCDVVLRVGGWVGGRDLMPLDMISEIHLGKQKICQICGDQMRFDNEVRWKVKFCSSDGCGV